MEVIFQTRHGRKQKLTGGAIFIHGVLETKFSRVEGLAEAWVKIATQGSIGWQGAFANLQRKLDRQDYAALMVLLISKTPNETFQLETLQAALNVGWSDLAPKYRTLFREALETKVHERALEGALFSGLCATLRVMTKANTLREALNAAKCTDVFQSEPEGAYDRVCVCGPGGTLTQTVLLQRLLPWEDEATVSG